jgi:hypothetical protein
MMPIFTQTLLLTFLIVAFALAALGISWLIKGKCRIQPGSCGRVPGKKEDSECGKGACGLCDSKNPDDTKKLEKEHDEL